LLSAPGNFAGPGLQHPFKDGIENVLDLWYGGNRAKLYFGAALGTMRVKIKRTSGKANTAVLDLSPKWETFDRLDQFRRYRNALIFRPFHCYSSPCEAALNWLRVIPGPGRISA
jgi:hypothetical protein